jgi:hypothetical protein
MGRFSRCLLVAAGAMVPALLSPVIASAQNFSFFGNLEIGSNPGTFAGTLTLAGFTAGATGTFSASTFTITQYPSGVSDSPEGNVATNWTFQEANSFTTVDGAITGWQFAAVTDGGPVPYYVCLNTDVLRVVRNLVCLEDLNWIGGVPSSGTGGFAFNVDGAQGLTFTPTSTPVPEPSSVLLLLAGTGAMAVVSQRRRRNGAAAEQMA